MSTTSTKTHIFIGDIHGRDSWKKIVEKGSWKIHNVRYTKGAGPKPTLQKTLHEFLKMEITQSIE